MDCFFDGIVGGTCDILTQDLNRIDTILIPPRYTVIVITWPNQKVDYEQDGPKR
jgi:hypothetical protein